MSSLPSDADHPIRLVVYSAAYVGDSLAEDLRCIKEQSQRNNPGRQVTGTLLFDRGRFVQAIEGPPGNISSLLQCIAQDRRAGALEVLLDVSVSARSFAAWAMWTGRLNDSTPTLGNELRTFRDAYLRTFRPSGAEFVALLQQAMNLGTPIS
ncbi:MAG: BLUF domain-containing protein [Myxococcota bacterium]